MCRTPPSIQLASDISTEDDIFSKIIWRLVPFLFFCYLAAYLDRGGCQVREVPDAKGARVQRNRLWSGRRHLFPGYVLEVPSNIILHKVGARL